MFLPAKTKDALLREITAYLRQHVPPVAKRLRIQGLAAGALNVLPWARLHMYLFDQSLTGPLASLFTEVHSTGGHFRSFQESLG